MALVSSEVRVAGTGEVFVAPPGTVGPTDASTALDAAFIGLGLTTNDGVSISRSVDRNPIDAWQSASPVRFVYSALGLTVAATFIQSNAEVLDLYLGGAAFAGTLGEYKTDISTIPVQDKRSLVVEWVDGDVTSRLYIPECEVTETGDLTLNAQSEQGYSLTFSALAPASGSVLASWLTTDANFAPAA